MQGNNLEIERKFLVKDDTYKALTIGHYNITQGYICREIGKTVRVRIRWNESGKGEAFLTIKSKLNPNGIARFEWENPIDPQDALQLLHLCAPPWIEKTRWIVPAQTPEPLPPGHELVWEIDEFHGHKQGLVLAELEMESETQAFIRPDFIGEEVTGNPLYHNANM